MSSRKYSQILTKPAPIVSLVITPTTAGTDGWSYKFYRYDARGRVTRFWHFINGLGWKSENYYYNSQNQVTRNYYQPGQTDGKLFAYSYDDAGRLIKTSLYIGSFPDTPEEELDYPSDYYTLSRYTYNENSQVSTHGLNIDQYISAYSYNDRNWVSLLTKQGGNPVFAYGLAYNPNGNIRRQSVGGTYLQNLSDQSPLQITYIYDQSNRLLKADRDSGTSSGTHDLINNYDKDGNFVNMKRYGSSDNLVDNFNNNYFSGTNRLQKVTGSADQYAYDANGNQTLDEVNRNKNFKYDSRNLLIEFRGIRQESGLMGLEDKTYMTLYKYDEAGNRTRKVSYKYTGSSPDPEFDLTGDAPPWQQVLDEFYVRDISGKEVAIYSSSSLTQWNIWGLDNVGKINADTTKYYYLKDHLGTIRVVLNSTNQVVSANDYDCWGFAMQNRSYQSGNTIYKFTGKERDNESSYDYFGARYYDSRVATWGSVDPLFEKHIQWTPYNYVLRNPLRLIDPDGRQVDVTNPIYHINKETTSLQLKAIEYNQNLETLSKKAMPYLIVTFNYTRKAAFGIYLNKQFGVVRNIPLISINSPTVLTVLATIAGILHATAPDLNKGEEKQLQEIKEEKEEAHYREVKELYDEYTKKTTDDKNQSSIINQTTPSKAILRITKGFNKVGF